MNILQSALKKLKNINLKGVRNGRHNLTTGEVDEIAKLRAAICATCPHNIKEPIPILRIQDEVITEINEKVCDVCGCALPYLTRQFDETCKLKKWDI